MFPTTENPKKELNLTGDLLEFDTLYLVNK